MDHVTAVETFARQLSDIGSPLTEPQIITKILCTLPPSFRTVISAWENLEDKMKTMDRLTNRLIKEEEVNKRFGGEVAKADAAFFAKQGGSSVNQASKTRRTCTYCGRQNHTEERCWDKAKDQEKQVNGTQAKFARGRPAQERNPVQESWSSDPSRSSLARLASQMGVGTPILEHPSI
jgi:hypothetical protein